MQLYAGRRVLVSSRKPAPLTWNMSLHVRNMLAPILIAASAITSQVVLSQPIPKPMAPCGYAKKLFSIFNKICCKNGAILDNDPKQYGYNTPSCFLMTMSRILYLEILSKDTVHARPQSAQQLQERSRVSKIARCSKTGSGGVVFTTTPVRVTKFVCDILALLFFVFYWLFSTPVHHWACESGSLIMRTGST